MAYSINYNDTSLEPTPITVADATVNTETSIKLVGKNYTNYGEVFNENFLRLLENFASETDGDSPGAPAGAVRGQLWYDATAHAVKFYDNAQWYPMATLKTGTALPVDASEPHQAGDLFFHTSEEQLYVSQGSSWLPISTGGATSVKTRTRYDTGGTTHKTLEFVVNSVIVAIVVMDTTAWNPMAAGANTEYLEDGATLLNTQFPTLQAGINMNTTTQYKFRGIATTAEYADVAERYHADKPYDAGTVVKIGGEHEITETDVALDSEVFGIISTHPGVELNAGAGPDETHPFVAIAGRVPCKVIGPVRKGQRLVTSEENGVARAPQDHEGEADDWYRVVGRALENKDTESVGMVEVVVGRM